MSRIWRIAVVAVLAVPMVISSPQFNWFSSSQPKAARHNNISPKYVSHNGFSPAPSSYKYKYPSEQQGSYNPYLSPEEDFTSDESVKDSIRDKNFDAPPVATAMTGGLPFISYALRGIAWLFVVGTLFLMFVGSLSAAFYRWTRAYASGREFQDISSTEFVMKAIELWNNINN